MSGRNLDLFKQLAPGSLTMFQWLYEQHKLDLVALLFYCFVLEEYKGGRLDHGAKGRKCDQVHCSKFPNS